MARSKTSFPWTWSVGDLLNHLGEQLEKKGREYSRPFYDPIGRAESRMRWRERLRFRYGSRISRIRYLPG